MSRRTNSKYHRRVDTAVHTLIATIGPQRNTQTLTFFIPGLVIRSVPELKKLYVFHWWSLHDATCLATHPPFCSVTQKEEEEEEERIKTNDGGEEEEEQ